MSSRAKNPTVRTITEQVEAHGIEFGKRYRDRASNFEGTCVSLYFFEHGCCRVALRGTNRSTGEATEATFDAPDLVAVDTEAAVPKGPRTGGSHDLHMNTRPGPR